MKLLIVVLSSMTLAAAFPHEYKGLDINSTSDLLTGLNKRTSPVHGLPHPWSGIFENVASIQPPLPIQVFAHFFAYAAKQAAADIVPGRPYQKITYGALVIEFWAKNSDVVTREFVQATANWLLDSAEKGWIGFFQAWVIDRADQEVICIQMGTGSYFPE